MATCDCRIEKGLYIGHRNRNDDTPRLYWQDNLTGNRPMTAGRGLLSEELPYTEPDTRAKWAAAVDKWLKDFKHDSLRARGAIQWRTVSRASVLIASAKYWHGE